MFSLKTQCRIQATTRIKMVAPPMEFLL
jgi:hypothetical protein